MFLKSNLVVESTGFLLSSKSLCFLKPPSTYFKAMGELLNRMASAAEDVEIMHDEPGDYSLDANVLFFGCKKGMGAGRRR